jgi:hypothetical protein
MMRKCQECGRTGSRRPDTVVLCEVCYAAIAKEVQERVRIIKEALQLLKDEKTLPAKLRHWDRILAQAEALYQYEQREILTTCPPPSTLLQDFRARREALLRAGKG